MIEELLEKIDSLKVAELAELVKAIEEKYGVSAVAAAAPAAGAVAGGAAKEKSSFDVVLKEAGANMIVAGTAIVSSENYKETIQQLKQ